MGYMVNGVKSLLRSTDCVLDKIKERAFDVSVDYKPNDNDLEPQKYFEEGYYQGQKEMLKILLSENLDK